MVAVISIGDIDSIPPKFTYRPDHLLRLEFDDISLDEYYDHKTEKDRLFKYSQAQQIAEFVYKHKDEIDVLICHCEYGQSRSAGCAAAIAEHFSKRGIEIFADDRYCPNKLVFRKVLQALKEYKQNTNS